MRAALAALCLLLAACGPQPAVTKGTMPELDPVFEFGSLEIVNDEGRTHVFDVYFARDFDQKRRGLMHVRSMPATTGMLFVWDHDDYHSMYMKNTYIPLDMLFVRSDGSVSSINADTVPLTLTSQSPVEPIRYVLELNGGTARRLRIGKRSRLLLDGS